MIVDQKNKKKEFAWCHNNYYYCYFRIVPIIIASTVLLLQSYYYYANNEVSSFVSNNNRQHNIIHDTLIDHDREHEEEEDDEDDDPQYALARKQSFGFFYDISNEHWNLHRQLFLQHVNHRYPDKPLTFHPEAREEDAVPEIYAKRKSGWKGWSSYEAWYQTNYEPNFSCPFEMRVGEPMNGDGPKWICDPHRIKKLAHDRKQNDPNHPGCVVYSIGSNSDFTFEMGVQKTVGEGVCEFHIFDFGDFEGAIPPELKRAKYHRWGLGKQDEPSTKKSTGSKKLYGLRDTIRMLGHENLDVIDVFKIDCEYCEWDTYEDWLSEDVPLLHQIQVELHRAPAKEGTGGAIDFFDSMERAGYLRFHKEPNIQWGPDCVEYSFIKVEKDFMEGK